MARPIVPRTEEAVGRLRPSVSPHLAKPQGWMRLDNVWASRELEGTIESVPGYLRAISSAASQDLRGLVYAKASDGTKLLLAVGVTSLFKIDLVPATFGTITTLATGLTYGQQFGHVTYNDTIYLFNAVAPKQITIASTPVVSNISSSRPDISNASTSKAGTGKVRGTVKYFLAQMTGTGDLDEGALSVEFGKINAKNGKKIDVDLTHADFQSNVYRLYRTVENGEDPFFVAEIDVAGGGTTYTDNIPDFGDGGLGDPPLLNGDPPPVALLPAIMHLERAWGAAAGSLLYYSDVNHPESWFTSADGNVVRVRANDGDEITALGIDGNDIVIWKRDHMYRLVGLVEEEFAIIDITQSTQDSRDIGTPTLNTVTAIPGGFAFYWNRAIYTLSRGRIQRISDEIESHLTTELDDLEDQIHLAYDSLNGRLWVSLPINRAIPSYTYFYSFKDEYWVGRALYGHRSHTYVEDDKDNLRLWAVGAG